MSWWTVPLSLLNRELLNHRHITNYIWIVHIEQNSSPTLFPKFWFFHLTNVSYLATSNISKFRIYKSQSWTPYFNSYLQFCIFDKRFVSSSLKNNHRSSYIWIGSQIAVLSIILNSPFWIYKWTKTHKTRLKKSCNILQFYKVLHFNEKLS